MLLERYEHAARLFNANLVERCSTAALDAYRGELILIDGEIGDVSGRRRPPVKVMQQVVALADAEQLHCLCGFLEHAADLAALLERYATDIHPKALCVIFVFDLDRPARLLSGALQIHLRPLDEGLVWTELMELAALEKGDIKHLSSADKVQHLQATLRENFDARPDPVDLAQALSLGNGRQRALRGAV